MTNTFIEAKDEYYPKLHNTLKVLQLSHNFTIECVPWAYWSMCDNIHSIFSIKLRAWKLVEVENSRALCDGTKINSDSANNFSLMKIHILTVDRDFLCKLMSCPSDTQISCPVIIAVQ